MTDVSLTFPLDFDPTVELSAAETTSEKVNAAAVFAGLAVPFGVASGPSQDGHRYRFSTGPDNLDELIDAVEEHDDDALVGRLSEPWEVTPAGLNARARIFDTTRGRDVVTERKEGARTGFSVKALIRSYTVAADGVRDVTAWTARHLGVVRRPAFSDTAGFQIACSASTTREAPAMTTTTTPPAVAELPTVAELAEKVKAELSFPTVAELAEQVRGVLKTDDDAHPLAAFSSLGHFLSEFSQATEEKREALQTAFAIPDQITANNPGVMPPGWRTQIAANLDARRPAIVSTGGSIALPPAGMDSNWPYFDGDLDAIITEQATQKTELSGVRIDIKKGSASIKTAGTISDIAYQLLERSSPSYQEAFMRICMAAWARYTEAQYEAALLAGGTDALAAVDVSTAAAFRAQLFEASADVEDATGAPADTVLVGRDVFVGLGGLDGLHNPKYGTQNAAGTSDARTLTIDVNGLAVQRAPFLGADEMIVTNGSAASFSETGPRVATEEDVKKLGRNVAVWGMYVPAEIYFPAGVRVYGPQA